MAVERLSPRVWSVGTWLPFPVHAWLVRSGEGLTLVDAGLASMARQVLAAIAATGLPLQRVVLTHGHFDHTGGLPALLAAWPVPVLAHPAEIPFLRGQRRYGLTLRRGRPPLWTGPGPAVAHRPAVAALRDGECPGGLTPCHCPGHTPGHTAYWLAEERLLLGGDLFSAYLPGRLGLPTPFLTQDMDQAVRSGALVEALRPERMAVCHGGVVRRPDLLYPAYRRRHLRK